MTRAPRTDRLRAATAALVLILGAAAPSFAQAPAPAPTPTPTPEATPCTPSRAEGPGGRLGGRLLRLQLQRDGPGAAQLRRAAQRLLAERGGGQLRQGADRRQPRRLPHRPVVRPGRRPDRALRAAEGGRAQLGHGRQGGLQEHPAGLRERPRRLQRADRRRQVRHPDRDRGDRGAGQLELHPLDPLRLRDPLLPHRPARHLDSGPEARPRGLPRERLEQRHRPRGRQDVRDRGDAEADRLR